MLISLWLGSEGLLHTRENEVDINMLCPEAIRLFLETCMHFEMKAFQKRIKYLNSNFDHDPWLGFLDLTYSLLLIRIKPVYTTYWIITNSESF